MPFGNYQLADPYYDKYHLLIHDYFFVKALDKVRPGGVIVFLTSTGTMDKGGTKVRDYLARRADLIGAVRLPNDTFKSAGTQAGADIIFLQKRKQLSELGTPQNDAPDTLEMPVIKGREKAAVDVELINEITPIGGISIGLRKIDIGGVTSRVYGVSGYPHTELNYGWLSDIMNNTEAVTCITFDPANPAQLADALSRSIKAAAGNAVSTKDVRESKNLVAVRDPHETVTQAFTRIMPLFTLAGGSPMCINSYQDAHGFYFAKTSTGNIVSIDMWYRGQDRTNSNFILLGKAGMGKSTNIKHILQTKFMNGTKILIIDPESEYVEITRHLGDSVLYAGGGRDKINILQVRPSPCDDEDESAETSLYSKNEKGNDLAMHLKNLDTIFRTYMIDAPEILYSVLEQCLIELHREFKMDWDTDYRKGLDFPVAFGTSVMSIAPGRVAACGVSRDYGDYIMLEHNMIRCDGNDDIIEEKTFYSFYAHLYKRFVFSGQTIEQGREIALSGGDPTLHFAGNSTGAHLHLELRKAPEYASHFDPYEYLLKPNPFRGETKSIGWR